MVRGKNHNPPGRVRLLQDRRQEPYRVNPPGDLNLLGLGEVIVYRVEHDTDDSLSCVAERGAHGRGESLGRAVGQLGLVEEKRGTTGLGDTEQFGMPGEPGFLARGVASRDATGQ